MEFLNPTALYGLLALPLLLIPYLIKRKPRRMVFSSLLLFTEVGSRTGGRPWGRLRLPPIFFLQFLLLTLLILALGEPVFSVRVSSIALLLDNSASMQTLENGKTRFALAQEKARGLLADLGDTGKVDLYLTAPRLERARSASFSPSEAARMIAGLEPYDVPDGHLDYATLSQMVREQKYERVYLLTDHPANGQTAALRVISVGQPKGNIAITSLQMSRASLVTSRLEATAEVTNFSSRDESIKIVLRGNGTILSSRALKVAAGKSAPTTFEELPLRAYYEAEIDVRDALPLDNHRFAVPPMSQSLSILGVSPRPQALASLRLIPGISLDITPPDDYEKRDRSGYELEIFHFSMPATLPRHSALFVLPPDNNPLAELGKPISRSVVSSWREPHPLTRYVNFALFRPPYARPLKPRVAGAGLIESPEGALAFAAERQGVRHLVLGFDPFPYLGRENLPVSVFTLNFLDWFFHGSGEKGKGTGEPLTFGAARRGDVLLTSRGDKVPLNPGSSIFAATFFQGIYHVIRGTERQLFAINLRNSNESDLREPAPIELHEESGSESRKSALFSIWPYLLLVSLLLLFVEWFVNPRALRSGSRLRSN